MESLIESIKNHHSLKSEKESEANPETNMADLITPTDGRNYELTNYNTLAKQSKAESLQPLGEEYPVSESQEMLGIEEIQQDS